MAPNREWTAIQRSMAVLQRLLQGEASAAQLIEAVLETVGPEAYPPEGEARTRAFKRDRENLKNRLHAQYTYDSRKHVYILQDPGPYASLRLTPEALSALGLLSHTFSESLDQPQEIGQLLDALIALLPSDEQRKLESSPLSLEMDFLQKVDTAPTPSLVWEKVKRALRLHRILAFNYLSPMQDDRQPRYHEAAPLQIRFYRGHWYVYVYEMLIRNQRGNEYRNQGYHPLRLNYIVEDERLAVLPSAIPSNLRRPPRYLVHYVLKPSVGRGAISQYFKDMHIEYREDGSAEVSGYTDDRWEAVRILLGYGENCTVLGDPEILKHMRQRVHDMAENYSLLDVEEF